MSWATWGVGFAPIGLQILSYVLGVEYPETAEVLDKVQSVVLALCSIAILVFLMIATSGQIADPVGALEAMAVVFTFAAGVVNPLKYIEIIGLTVPIMDIFGGWASAACTLAATGLGWDDPVKVALT